MKPEIAEKISSELKEINFIYGLDSNIYWELVRKNSIKYWLDLDRHEIFIIEEILIKDCFVATLARNDATIKLLHCTVEDINPK